MSSATSRLGIRGAPRGLCITTHLFGPTRGPTSACARQGGQRPSSTAGLYSPTKCLSRKRLFTSNFSDHPRRPVVRMSRRKRSEIGGQFPVTPGVVSPRRSVPDHIPKTPYYATGIVPPQEKAFIVRIMDCGVRRSNDRTHPPHITSQLYLHTEDSLGPMREACVLARLMLDLCCSLAKPGVTTDAIDAEVHSAIVEAGACPSPLNYHGFPKSVCSSVNEVACHAIPDNRPLCDGDIVSFDVSVFYKGYHGDNCATVGVGQIDDRAQRLIDATKEALKEGVAVCQPGACLTEIGAAVHAVAEGYGYDTIRKYCGHGVGQQFHMLPFVQHFRNQDFCRLCPGMTFTIEPILTEGNEKTITWSDYWTVATVDGGRAAQFEHVVLITEEGHEILTVPALPPS